MKKEIPNNKMETNRRSFLKLFSSASLFAFGDPSKLFIQEGDHFFSKRLGVEISLPKHWVYWPPNLIDQRSWELYEQDPELMQASALVLYTEFQEPVPQWNPSIGIFATEWEDWMGDDMLSFMSAHFEYSVEAVSGTVLETPFSRSIDKCNAAESAMQWREFDERGTCHIVRGRTTFVRNSNCIIRIDRIDSPSQGRDHTDLFSSVMDTARIHPPVVPHT